MACIACFLQCVPPLLLWRPLLLLVWWTPGGTKPSLEQTFLGKLFYKAPRSCMCAWHSGTWQGFTLPRTSTLALPSHFVPFLVYIIFLMHCSWLTFRQWKPAANKVADLGYRSHTAMLTFPYGVITYKHGVRGMFCWFVVNKVATDVWNTSTSLFCLRWLLSKPSF